MMGTVTKLFEEFKKNELGYPHVVCSKCDGSEFYIATHQGEGGVWQWKWIVCANCHTYIPVSMDPVFGPGEPINTK